MSTKVVVLQRNEGDFAKLNGINEFIDPSYMIEYRFGGPIPVMPEGAPDSIDYLLMTGGHGDFREGAPVELNGVDRDAVQTWCNTINAEFKIIILDTCFSSGFIPMFNSKLAMGGFIVCAHGSGEGFTDALVNPNNVNRTIGEALSQICDGLSGLGISATSLSLYVRSGQGLKLYTSNIEGNRASALRTRESFGMDSDSQQELESLDRYITGKLISIESLTLEELKAKLTNMLKVNI